MNHPAPFASTRNGTDRDEMRDLLGRYPGLDGSECARLVRLMKSAPLLEVCMLSSDPELGGNYQAFRAGEAARFRPTAWEIAKFLALCVAPGGLFIWAAAQLA